MKKHKCTEKCYTFNKDIRIPAMPLKKKIERAQFRVIKAAKLWHCDMEQNGFSDSTTEVLSRTVEALITLEKKR